MRLFSLTGSLNGTSLYRLTRSHVVSMSFYRNMFTNTTTSYNRVFFASQARKLISDTEAAKNFCKIMLNHMTINTYYPMFKIHPYVLEQLFTVCTKDENSKLAQNIFDNLGELDNDSEIIRKSIKQSSTFCDLIMDRVISDKSFFDKLDSSSLTQLVNKVSSENKLKFFKFVLDNKETMILNPVIIESNRGFDELNRDLIKLVIEEKRFRILKKLSSDKDQGLGIPGMYYWFCPLMTNDTIQQWEKFALDNFQEIINNHKCSFLFDRLDLIGSKDFKDTLQINKIENYIRELLGH